MDQEYQEYQEYAEQKMIEIAERANIVIKQRNKIINDLKKTNIENKNTIIDLNADIKLEKKKNETLQNFYLSHKNKTELLEEELNSYKKERNEIGNKLNIKTNEIMNLLVSYVEEEIEEIREDSDFFRKKEIECEESRNIIYSNWLANLIKN